MLNSDSRPVVSNVALLDSFDEGYGETRAEDDSEVAEGEAECIAREEVEEVEGKGHSCRVYASDVGRDCRQEHGYPKERKEALYQVSDKYDDRGVEEGADSELISSGRVVLDIEMGLAGVEGDHGFELLGGARAKGSGDIEGALVCLDGAAGLAYCGWRLRGMNVAVGDVGGG